MNTYVKGLVPENYTELYNPEDQSKQKSLDWYDDASEDESEPVTPSTQEGDFRKESISFDTNSSQDEETVTHVNIDNVALTCSWAPPDPETSYTCEVGPGKKLTKYGGIKTIVIYGITPSFSNIQVSRRSSKQTLIFELMTSLLNSFHNFSWLHGCLVTKYGSVVVIPPIPESVLYGDLEDELIEKRRIGFQKFASRICRHPVLSNSEAWKLFLTETNDKVWYSKKLIAALCFFSEMERRKKKNGVRCSEQCQNFNSSENEILPEDTGVLSTLIF